MFARRQQPTKLQPVPAREGQALIDKLALEPHENTYLLGLLHDYTLRGLLQMNWGNFYCLNDPYPQILYQDVTGLVVATRIDSEALPKFTNLLNTATVRTTRIISNEETARGLHTGLMELSPRWKRVRVDFEEKGMILKPEDLALFKEPNLRLARPDEAEKIAEGSAEAMLEEIGLETGEQDFDRLIRSKSDLIERGRYYVLEESNRIVFQAYFSALLPVASQIQGVWVPPTHRNRGVATQCLAEMCRRTLLTSESIVLRVQTRNASARRAYEKVGFRDFLDYRSIWFA